MNPVNTARLHLVKTLSLGVGQARSWSELEGICTDINAVFLAGELSSEGLEVLCAYVAQRARSLSDRSEHSTEKSYDPAVPSCDCCGSTAFRESGSQAVCTVCHPDPLRHSPHRRAA